MKFSKFIVLIPYKNAYIAFNTLWNTSIIIHQQDIDRWGFKGGNINIIAPELASILQEKHFIIEDNIDELNIISSQLRKTNSNTDFFELTIIPTLACNYKCWYCYENHTNTEHITPEEIDRIILMLDNIVSTNQNINRINFQFFGGEPLLCYKTVIRPLLLKYKEHNRLQHYPLQIGITTNGHFITTEILQFLSQFNIGAFQITIDGNKNQHNSVRYSKKGEDTYSRIISNIKKCLNHRIHIVMRINISNDTNIDVENLVKDFDNTDNTDYLCFSIHKVWQADDSVHNRIDTIVNLIRQKGYKCVSYYSTPSSIWETCYADKNNHLVINPHGKIFKCTARDFNDSQIEGYLGSTGQINWLPRHYKREEATPLNNSSCRDCKILPICIGGCSQKLIEHNNTDNCILGMNEDDKVQYALRVFNEHIK